MTILIIFLLAPLAVLTLCFAIELFAGLRPLRDGTARLVPTNRAAVIVPAHNEASILGPRLAALKDAATSARLIVVADNCSDETAAIARRLKIEVIERDDPTRRGKGFALDYAKQHLSSNPPDAVIIIDADCSIDGASLRLLMSRCIATGAPCQAVNLQRPQADASPAVQLSTFAFFVKNVIRQRALKRLAGRVQLLGTGMAMPWTLFATANLATSSIVEDIKLGYELAEAGHAPVLVEGAEIWSEAETSANTLAQRQRWEGGFLSEALRAGPSRLVRSVLRADTGEIWAALSIMIPPFALLVIADVIMLAVAALATWAFSASPVASLVLAVPLILAALGLALAWRNGGSRFVSLAALLRAPLYVLWKLPMYLRFARRGVPKTWVRTDRG